MRQVRIECRTSQTRRIGASAGAANGRFRWRGKWQQEWYFRAAISGSEKAGCPGDGGEKYGQLSCLPGRWMSGELSGGP